MPGRASQPGKRLLHRRLARTCLAPPTLPGCKQPCRGRPQTRHELRHDFDAGWSSPVARQAHNLKVVGSNPTPATKLSPEIRRLASIFRAFSCAVAPPPPNREADIDLATIGDPLHRSYGWR